MSSGHTRLVRTGMRPLRTIRDWSRLRKRRRTWESRWADEDYSRLWMKTGIPDEVKAAVDSEWFPPGATILDIGCGSGEIAAWLAEQGFDLLGIDLAKGAIRSAKSRFDGSQGELEFKVMDICRESPPARFNALLDRGCLHGIDRDLWPLYVRNVASCSLPGATSLLLAPTMSPAEMTRQIETAFWPFFEMSKAEEAYLAEGVAGVRPHRSLDPGDPIPGMAFWMVRREV